MATGHSHRRKQSDHAETCPARKSQQLLRGSRNSSAPRIHRADPTNTKLKTKRNESASVHADINTRLKTKAKKRRSRAYGDARRTPPTQSLCLLQRAMTPAQIYERAAVARVSLACAKTQPPTRTGYLQSRGIECQREAFP